MILTLLPLEGFELRNESKRILMNFWMKREKFVDLFWKPEDIFEDDYAWVVILYYFSSSLQLSFEKDSWTLSYVEVTRHFPGLVELFGFQPFAISSIKNLELLNENWLDDKNNSERGYSYIYNDIELSLWRPILPTRAKGDDFENGRKFTTVWIGKAWTWSSNM